MYNILAICGESSAGKDSILKELCRRYDFINPIVSHTTRKKRDYEIEAVDYHFITCKQMANNILENKMLEVSEFNGDFYGTSFDALKDNQLNIGVFNPTGIRDIIDLKDSNINLMVVRVMAQDKTRLIRSLSRENEPNIEEVFRRFMADKKDFAHLEFLNIVPSIKVVNDSDEDLNDCTLLIYNRFLKDYE